MIFYGISFASTVLLKEMSQGKLVNKIKIK